MRLHGGVWCHDLGTRTALGWVISFACACGQAHPDSPQPDAAAEPQPDAAMVSSQFDAVAYENSLVHRSPHPTLPARALTSEEAEWAAATEFEIRFETGIWALSPMYALTFASNGEVRFTGYQNTWKPGTYLFERSEADARTLYRNLIVSGLLDLPQSCTERADWRYVVGQTDRVSKVFILRAGGREKKFVNLDPCGGEAPSWETEYALEREIVAATAIEPYLKSEELRCSDYPDTKTLLAGFVVRDAKQKAVGLLRVTRLEHRVEWNLASCGGESIARGELSAWGCDLALISSDEAPFSWPSVRVRPSGAVLRDVHAGRTEFPLTLYTFDAEVRQRVTSGDRCD